MRTCIGDLEKLTLILWFNLGSSQFWLLHQLPPQNTSGFKSDQKFHNNILSCLFYQLRLSLNPWYTLYQIIQQNLKPRRNEILKCLWAIFYDRFIFFKLSDIDFAGCESSVFAKKVNYKESRASLKKNM